MRRKRSLFELPFFMFLFAAYPAVSLLGDNITEVNPSVALRPLLASLLLAAVLFGLLYLALRKPYRAAFLSAALLILFFSYGHVLNFITAQTGQGSTLRHHAALLAVFFLLFLAAARIILRAKDGLTAASRILNIVALGLLLLPAIQIVDHGLRILTARGVARQASPAQANIAIPGSSGLPDVYYIILDMYTRDDVLKQVYGMDNQPFLDQLAELGFTVARCSQSNYSQTQLSVSSSLNMNYLTALGSFPEDSADRTALSTLIERSAVREFFETRGYKTVSISAYSPLRVESAETYISTDPQHLPAAAQEPVVNSFEALFIQNSALALLNDLPQTRGLRFVKEVNYPYALHIRQQLYILNQLNRIPELAGPKFVFAHVQIPHPPYVFGPNGEIVEDPPPFPFDPKNPVPEERANALYSDQVRFINARIVEIVQTILRVSPQPPVIVLQGDHGASLEFRMPILNAYYLPESHRNVIYPGVTPVNSFRLIFNEVFGASYELLPDISYDSTYEKPFRYFPARDQREGCPPGN